MFFAGQCLDWPAAAGARGQKGIVGEGDTWPPITVSQYINPQKSNKLPQLVCTSLADCELSHLLLLHQ